MSDSNWFVPFRQENVGLDRLPPPDTLDLLRAVNQTLIADTSLICIICKDYLTSPVHLDQDGQNVCGQCALCYKDDLSNAHKLYPNIALEEFLKHLKFPCRSCKTLTSYEKISQHKQKHYFKCALCRQLQYKSKYWYSYHLKVEHKITHIDKNSTKFDMEIDLPLNTPEYKIITFASYDFLLTYHQQNDMIAITLSRVSEETTGNDTFTIQLTTDNLHHSQSVEGKCLQWGDALDGNGVEITIGEATNCKLEISLGSLSTNQPSLPEFANSSSSGGVKVRQCENNHILCVDSIRRMNKCPQCNMPINKEESYLGHVLPDRMWDCPKGCTAVISYKEMDQHLDICENTLFKCTDCPKNLNRLNIVEHLQKHSIKFDVNLNKPCYLKALGTFKYYELCENGHFVAMVKVTSTSIKFKCKMLIPLHRVKKTRNYAEQYRYEFHLSDNEDTLIAKEIFQGDVNNSDEEQSISLRIKATKLLYFKFFVYKNET